MLGPVPIVTTNCVVTVLMWCAEGMPIPQGHDGMSAGFPMVFPPGGLTSHYVADGVSGDGDEIGKLIRDDITMEKSEMGENLSPSSDFRSQMDKFNSQARFDRRLYVAEMKATWDFEHHSRCKEGDLLLWQEGEYAKYLDYMVEKMNRYDEDYRDRAKTLKLSMRRKQDELSPIIDERARRDAEYILRQTRTENLWKGLARLRQLGAMDKIPRSKPRAPYFSPCREHEYDPMLDPELEVDCYVEEVLPKKIDIE
jgi:hypothetical protein